MFIGNSDCIVSGENVFANEYEHIEVFGSPALFTNGRINHATVPKGWYSYDLRGSDRDHGRPATLERRVTSNHAGAVVLPAPVPFPAGQDFLYAEEAFHFLGEELTLVAFCQEHRLPIPPESQRYIPRLTAPEETGLFYALTDPNDPEPLYGLTEEGQRRLQGAGDPRLPHTYSWYVCAAGNGGERVEQGLSAEEAIGQYLSLDGDKRLGVVKDGIAAVDMSVCRGGEERCAGDCLREVPFAYDPVIAEAAERIRMMQREQAAEPTLRMEGGICL